jgi:hypothetical protein
MVRTEEIIKTVPEEGTAIFRLVCKDEDGVLIAPVTLAWDLTALDGTVIAYNQTIVTPLATYYLPIYGTNLRMLDGESSYGERLLTFRGTYNSTRASGLPLHKQIKFRIQNLRMIGYPLDIAVHDFSVASDYLSAIGVA